MQTSFQLYKQESNRIWKQKSQNFDENTYQPTIEILQTNNTPCVWLKYNSIQTTMIPAQGWPQQLIDNLSFAFQAKSQLQGKGQGTNSWASPPGNIYLTILTRIKQNVAGILPIVACSAVLKTILEEFPDLKAQCKWINDVFIENKKVAGLLANCTIYGQKYIATIGVGLNIMAAPLEGSTCLMRYAQNEIDINRMSERLIRNIAQGLQLREQSIAFYQQSLMFKGQKVKIMDKELKNVLNEGIFLRINEYGHAILLTQGKEIVVHSGRMREIVFSPENEFKNNNQSQFESKTKRSQCLL